MSNNQQNSEAARFKHYLALRKNFLQLTIYEEISLITSRLTHVILLMVLGFFVLLFSSFGFVAWYGEQTGSVSTGYLIISLFDLAILSILIIFRKSLVLKPLRALLMGSLLEMNKDLNRYAKEMKDEPVSAQVKLVKMLLMKEIISHENHWTVFSSTEYWRHRLSEVTKSLLGVSAYYRTIRYYFLKFIRRSR